MVTAYNNNQSPSIWWSKIIDRLEWKQRHGPVKWNNFRYYQLVLPNICLIYSTIPESYCNHRPSLPRLQVVQFSAASLQRCLQFRLVLMGAEFNWGRSLRKEMKLEKPHGKNTCLLSWLIENKYNIYIYRSCDTQILYIYIYTYTSCGIFSRTPIVNFKFMHLAGRHIFLSLSNGWSSVQMSIVRTFLCWELSSSTYAQSLYSIASLHGGCRYDTMSIGNTIEWRYSTLSFKLQEFLARNEGISNPMHQPPQAEYHVKCESEPAN